MIQPMTLGHSPFHSAPSRTRISMWMILSLSRVSALGCTAPQPRPVPPGKDMHALLNIPMVNGGEAAATFAGQSGVGRSETTAHCWPQAVRCSSASLRDPTGDLMFVVALISCSRALSQSDSSPIPAISSETPASSSSCSGALLLGTHPFAIRDSLCCLPRPLAGPSCTHLANFA